MTKIKWDDAGKRFYENGVDHGVLYVQKSGGTYETGIAWNGLISVAETPSGAEPTDLWADNIKYGTLRSAETLGGTITAYMYPDEFSVCDGSVEIAKGAFAGQQNRTPFGLCYRTNIGSDASSEAGYKLHLVYGATASPSERTYESVNDSPDGMQFAWEFTTNPINVDKLSKPTASLVIDSRRADPLKLAELEKKLYGDEDGEATLVMPDEVLTILGEADSLFG